MINVRRQFDLDVNSLILHGTGLRIAVALSVKMDTHSRIELLHPSVLSSIGANYKNDIHTFSNSLSDQESTEIPIYT